ncbi:InlB B-repeat-containing protein [uncultured Pseudoflavonifractor sp.]|uniref:InlB B-repeat-containing protein n=1 Tax=uncultured Pseudoflavonifractor sp. TaxID=1221379 RepID=UPI0025FCF15E|nr:InlB B-repeat-containing protein [uncultured Pseudoflavonifractor sp.]
MLARMSKKALALLMVFCMVVSALSVGALAAVDTPNGTYDGILTFEYHITADALEDMVKNETEYTANDVCGATLFFENCSRNLEPNWVAGIYWTAVSALEEKHPQDMIALELYLDNGCTQKTLHFSDEELQALFYEKAASGFYEIELKDSGSTEPGDPALSLQDVYVYVDAKDGQGTPNGHGYFTVGKIQMELPDPTAVVAGDNYYSQYGSNISLENIERFEANSWLDLADVEWYKLLVADGADDYVDSGRYVWHLDGKILDKVQLYYVTYDANGGTGRVTDENGYMAGQSFTPKSGDSLTREGYTFVGWSTDKNAVEADSSFAIPAEGGDVTLYAVWKADEPAVKNYILQYYYKDNNTLVSFDSQSYEEGQTAVVIDREPTLPGYTFTGWNTDLYGAGTAYKAGDEIVMTDNVSLYAQWTWNGTEPEPDTYTVTYVWVGDIPAGVTLPASASYAADTEVTVAPAPAQVEGYTFSGWSCDLVTIRDGKFIMPPQDVYLLGVWTKDGGTEPEPNTYTITFKTEAGGTINGGTADVTGTYSEGAAFPERPTTAANSGYVFDGWYDESGNKVTEWPATVTASATYTARWTEESTGPIDPGPSYDYYRVTVNYLDRADGSKIANSYTSPSRMESSRYDVSEYDAIAINGYTYDATEGDPVSGVLNGNKTVNVYYVADETDIDDGDTPTTDLPDVPGDGGEVDIDDGDTPTTDLPGTGDTGSTGDGGETDIPDTGTPTGSLPQTGTQAQTSAARVALSVMALTASLAAAGLALLLFRKSRKNA